MTRTMSPSNPSNTEVVNRKTPVSSTETKPTDQKEEGCASNDDNNEANMMPSTKDIP